MRNCCVAAADVCDLKTTNQKNTTAGLTERNNVERERLLMTQFKS